MNCDTSLWQYSLCFYIWKVDGKDGRQLSGAEFTLTGADGTVQRASSDCCGRVRFHAMPCAEYVLREVAPPPGYVAPVSEYAVRINCDGTLFVDGAPTRCLRIENKCI